MVYRSKISVANRQSTFSDENNTNKELHTQLQISWYYMLCGMLTENIVSLQQSFYNDIDSKRSAQRWATNLIKQLWNIIHQLWLQRNEALHQKDSIYKLSRLQILMNSITNEYNYGLADLPSIYSSYFNTPLPIILKKSSKFLKRWFLLIWSDREATVGDSPPDMFSVKGHMRNWVRLTSTPKTFIYPVEQESETAVCPLIA